MKTVRLIPSSSRLALLAISPFLLHLATTGLNGQIALSRQELLPSDVRLQPLKDLNGYFPFTPPQTKDAWDARAEYVRRRMRVALGLWPLPTRTPLNPVLHGAIEREDYRVEKVFFESVPGFFVTGSLYRPLHPKGKVPGVLFAHGHWKDGRMMDQGEDAVRREIAQGAEHFEVGGRSIMQAMCVGLARMGCVVFHYDMVGYADSRQISQELAHGFKQQRPEMNTVDNWGLFSPQAEAHLQSVLGLQAWNSMRALDFLLTLPEVDPERVACTGASGGGTQTFILAALDPRVKLAFPAVMVSTAMQGGCTCENACLLRIDTGNVEFAGLIAPRPLGMTTANDWTKEMATKGFPEIKRLYELLGAGDRVALFRGEHFEHNYNSVSRVAFYGWLNRHFRLGLREPVLERDYHRLTRDQQTVWDDAHPAPPGGPDFERALLKTLWHDAEQQLAATTNDSAGFRRTHSPAIESVLGRSYAEAGEVTWSVSRSENRDWGLVATGHLRNTTHGEELPFVICRPKSANGGTVLWLSDAGKTGLFATGEPLPAVQRLLKQGVTVCSVDLLFQGDFLRDDQKPFTRTRTVDNPRESAAYTFGYNNALFARRVHDVLTALRYLRSQPVPPSRLTVVGLGANTGPILAAALAVSGNAIDAAAVDTHGFRFGRVLDLRDVSFLPGGAKYGDLPGMMSLTRVKTLWLAGEPESTAARIRQLSDARADSAPTDLKSYEDAVSGWILRP